MNLIDLVALLALLQLTLFSMLVGRARMQHHVRAPAVSGNEAFERAYRVQMNTIEQLVVFLPALYIAARYWPQTWVAALGAVYLVGRLVYRQAYLADPDKRGPGFMLTALPTLLLLLGGLVGVLRGAARAARPEQRG